MEEKGGDGRRREERGGEERGGEKGRRRNENYILINIYFVRCDKTKETRGGEMS